MMRSFLLWLSERQSIFNFARRNRLARGMAARFVAGETIKEVVAAVQELRDRGLGSTADLLGESVTDLSQVDAARDTYLALLEALHDAGLDVNASLKLTQFGFDIDEQHCEEAVRTVVQRAQELGGFIRLDMESSEYTERTLAFHRRLVPDFGQHVGVVIQASLRRSTTDIDRLVEEGTRVRLCKGAYLEPEKVAYPRKSDVDAHYIRLMESLLKSDTFHGIATHDEAMLEHAKAFVTEHDIGTDQFEFQMLYGVRRDLQDTLAREGWGVRVYVPFGSQWYPYLMRRLAERPANVFFIVGNILKEGRRRQ